MSVAKSYGCGSDGPARTHSEVVAARDAAWKAERERVQRERREAEARAWAAVWTGVLAGDLYAYREHFERLCQRDGFRIVWLPAGGACRSNWSTRTITTCVFATEEDVATGFHEYGHLKAGPCPRTGRHFHDARVRTSFCCQGCEDDASKIAMEMVPFTPRMHARLAYALGTYRRTIWAPKAEAIEAARIAGSVTRATLQLRQIKRLHRLDRQRAAMASLKK